jgi:hypothetical protein
MCSHTAIYTSSNCMDVVKGRLGALRANTPYEDTCPHTAIYVPLYYMD